MTTEQMEASQNEMDKDANGLHGAWVTYSYGSNDYGGYIAVTGIFPTEIRALRYAAKNRDEVKFLFWGEVYFG